MPLRREDLRRTAVSLALVGALVPAALAAPPAVPDFPSSRAADWIGSPATWHDLRGRVVLLDVWTFACSNCQATIPWLKEVRARYADRGLALVGIHTPELPFEHERSRVEAAVREHGLDYPHLLDNDGAYWRALGNEYWPTVYLVDRCGRLRARQIGEVHSGQESGQRMDARIEALLAETTAACSPGAGASGP